VLNFNDWANFIDFSDSDITEVVGRGLLLHHDVSLFAAKDATIKARHKLPSHRGNMSANVATERASTRET